MGLRGFRGSRRTLAEGGQRIRVRGGPAGGQHWSNAIGNAAMVLPIIVLGNETTLAASDQVSAKEFLKLRRVGLGRIQCVGQRQSTLVFNAKVTNQCKSLRSCKGDGIPRTVLVEQWRSALGLSRLLVPCSLDSVPRSKRLEQLTAVVNRSQSSATLLADCEWMLRAYLGL